MTDCQGTNLRHLAPSMCILLLSKHCPLSVKILSGRALHSLLDKSEKERTVPAPIPQTPMTKSTLNTADPKIVPTPMSPLVMKTPVSKGRKFVGEFLHNFFS